MKPLIYTEVVVLKITPIQKQTLDKLKQRNIKVMTLREKFWNVNENSFTDRMIANEKIAEDFAIGFAHFLANHTYSCYENGWSTDFGNKELTTKELLEIYKKEKKL